MKQLKTLIKDATIINEGLKFKGSVLISNDTIEKIFPYITPENVISSQVRIIDASGLYLIPGVIDSHVHFREPGLTYKAEIATESKAAVAGGITSYMEMPNTIPQTITLELLEEKFLRAAEVSRANYSFYLGTTNDNLGEVNRANLADICGLELLMGSETGNM